MTPLRLRVLLFARYREAAGAGSVEVMVASPASIGQVWRAVQESVPALQGIEAPLMALAQAYVPAEHPVREGDEVAFFPPVSGG